MKAFCLVLLSAAVASACAPKGEPAAQASVRCEQTATRLIAFFGAEPVDTLEAHASGDDCKHSVITVSVHAPKGAPIAALAAPIADLRGKLKASEAVTPEELAGFLKTYVAEMQVDPGASTLPEWRAAEPGPGFGQGMELTAEVDRETYERLRLAKPNMLCLKDSVDGSLCQVWDKAADKSWVIVRAS